MARSFEENVENLDAHYVRSNASEVTTSTSTYEAFEYLDESPNWDAGEKWDSFFEYPSFDVAITETMVDALIQDVLEILDLD